MIHSRTAKYDDWRIFRHFPFIMALTLGFAGGSGGMAEAGQHRDPGEQPFSADSVWNTPIGRGAIYDGPDSPESRLLHTDDAGGRAGSYPWIGWDAIGLYQARASDPIRRWSYDVRAAGAPWRGGPPMQKGWVDLPTPADIRFLGGTDKHAILIDPGHRYAYEVWLGEARGEGYHAAYLVRTDLRGSGISAVDGQSQGIRAFGGSLAGGLIRCRELANGDIPHALAVLLSNDQLRKGGTMFKQKVWPASFTDSNGRNGYAGLVPMGALLAIPADVDVEALPLTREGKVLARAYQRFGGYVVDRTSKTMTLATLEQGCGKTAVDHLMADRRTIRDRLVRILNNGPRHVGGPGARIAVAPPPLNPE
ncbi:hypothetical protein [Sphingomonas fuzhouensis]|uniref:hypothetical protein n=1 Tax=Sphingomonas fuzhouensis TaxID=3106033 RepID=UPI002AFFF644|nr:hypothetical protein [Sphingomonas sp. SGZ-02]